MIPRGAQKDKEAGESRNTKLDFHRCLESDFRSLQKPESAGSFPEPAAGNPAYQTTDCPPTVA